MLEVLTIGKEGNDASDTLSRGTTNSTEHEDELKKIIISWSAKRLDLRRENTNYSYHIHILATNTLFHLNRDFSIVETTHSTISHFSTLKLLFPLTSTQTFRNTICKSTVTVSRNNLQFMTTRNEMVFKSTRMQTCITIQ